MNQRITPNIMHFIQIFKFIHCFQSWKITLIYKQKFYITHKQREADSPANKKWLLLRAAQHNTSRSTMFGAASTPSRSLCMRHCARSTCTPINTSSVSLVASQPHSSRNVNFSFVLSSIPINPLVIFILFFRKKFNKKNLEFEYYLCTSWHQWNNHIYDLISQIVLQFSIIIFFFFVFISKNEYKIFLNFSF